MDLKYLRKECLEEFLLAHTAVNTRSSITMLKFACAHRTIHLDEVKFTVNTFKYLEENCTGTFSYIYSPKLHLIS